MSFWEIVLLALVEGLTEFLPVSSTGHMIITSWLLGIESSPQVKIFEVSIQLGAILSVLVLYFRRFFQSIELYFKLLAAFIPTAVIGFLLDDFIDSLLSNVLVVAASLIVGGLVLVFVDRWFKRSDKGIEQLPYLNAAWIGFFQCISMIPGVSRSAATIIGGQVQGLNRKAAAEFSFFLAVPTMLGATCLKLYKGYKDIPSEFLSDLLLGNVVAFVVAMLAIKFFIGILTRYGFKFFGYYRIVAGLLIIALYLSGVQLSVD